VFDRISLGRNGGKPEGRNSKLHAVCDGRGRQLFMLLGEGQMSDYKGAGLMLRAFLNLIGRSPSVMTSVYRHRHKIKNVSGRAQDWQRIHTRSTIRPAPLETV
jgi:hypothetical protein